MTWVALHTFAYQEVPTAANLNNNFANLNETSPGKVTTKADMTAATGANSIARVAGGSVRYWAPVTIPAESTGIKFNALPVQLDYNYAKYTVSNTASETDTWSYSLAAGALGARERMEMKFRCLYLNNTGSGRTFTLKFYIGATAYTLTSGTFGANATQFVVDVGISIRPANATNSQEVFYEYSSGQTLATYGNFSTQVNQSPSETNDFSTAKTLKFSITLSFASASHTMIVYHPSILVYPGMT
jgi:hypothetical protein